MSNSSEPISKQMQICSSHRYKLLLRRLIFQLFSNIFSLQIKLKLTQITIFKQNCYQFTDLRYEFANMLIYMQKNKARKHVVYELFVILIYSVTHVEHITLQKDSECQQKAVLSMHQINVHYPLLPQSILSRTQHLYTNPHKITNLFSDPVLHYL